MFVWHCCVFSAGVEGRSSWGAAVQWFGDLVTMRDWGELWLNEGFATYFENVGASIARPNFAYFETFFSDFGTSAMATDALPKSTHPLATTSGESCRLTDFAHQLCVTRFDQQLWCRLDSTSLHLREPSWNLTS